MTTRAPSAKSASVNYGAIFIILAVFTGLEVAAASYLQAILKDVILVLLAVGKAVLVALYFMHLKSDDRLYAWPFILGLIVIIPLILVILTTLA